MQEAFSSPSNDRARRSEEIREQERLFRELVRERHVEILRAYAQKDSTTEETLQALEKLTEEVCSRYGIDPAAEDTGSREARDILVNLFGLNAELPRINILPDTSAIKPKKRVEALGPQPPAPTQEERQARPPTIIHGTVNGISDKLGLTRQQTRQMLDKLGIQSAGTREGRTIYPITEQLRELAREWLARPHAADSEIGHAGFVESDGTLYGTYEALADILGVSRPYLRNLIQKYGLERVATIRARSRNRSGTAGRELTLFSLPDTQALHKEHPMTRKQPRPNTISQTD